MDTRLVDVIETDDFYEGESQNHIHQALGLSLASVKLAHLSVDRATLREVSRGNTISFTSHEERQFAILQLHANKYLKSKGRKPLPLLHLSPRMLLPYNNLVKAKNESADEVGASAEGNMNNNCTETPKKKSRRRRKPRSSQNDEQRTMSTEMISSSSGNEHKCSAIEGVTETETVSLPNSSAMPPPLSSSRSHQRHWLTLSIPMSTIEPVLVTFNNEEDHLKLFDLCSMYEREIMSVRETYENAIQAANLKLFIANTEIEKLREEAAKKLPT